MDRAEFMRRLTGLLSDVPPAEREEAIQYYNDYFDDAGEENEQGVIASLGSPEELAKSIKAGLFDGENAGEFTESGFRGYEERRRNEVMRMQRPEGRNSGGGAGAEQFSGGAWGSPDGQPKDAQYQTGGQQAGYQQAGQQQAGNNPPPPKKPMSGGKIALIVFLAIITSPAWIGFVGGLFGGSVGLIAGLFGIFMAFLAVGVAMTAVGISLIVAGIVAMFGAPLGGLCLIGGGLILSAIGLVFFWLMVLVVGTVIPAIVRGVVSLCRRIFHRGGAKV